MSEHMNESARMCDMCAHALTGRCPTGKCERVTGVCTVTGRPVAESHPVRRSPEGSDR